MNESNKFFAGDLAVLDEFLERSHRALLEAADERKMAHPFFDFTDFPRPKVSVENLQEGVKSGLPLHVAKTIYGQIEISARRHVYKLRKKLGDAYSGLAQVRAKYRGEELESESEDQIERDATRWVNDLWSEAVEHQAAM